MENKAWKDNNTLNKIKEADVTEGIRFLKGYDDLPRTYINYKKFMLDYTPKLQMLKEDLENLTNSEVKIGLSNKYLDRSENLAEEKIFKNTIEMSLNFNPATTFTAREVASVVNKYLDAYCIFCNNKTQAIFYFGNKELQNIYANYLCYNYKYKDYLN